VTSYVTVPNPASPFALENAVFVDVIEPDGRIDGRRKRCDATRFMALS